VRSSDLTIRAAGGSLLIHTYSVLHSFGRACLLLGNPLHSGLNASTNASTLQPSRWVQYSASPELRSDASGSHLGVALPLYETVSQQLSVAIQTIAPVVHTLRYSAGFDYLGTLRLVSQLPRSVFTLSIA
jgi:hypothetical protein